MGTGRKKSYNSQTEKIVRENRGSVNVREGIIEGNPVGNVEGAWKKKRKTSVHPILRFPSHSLSSHILSSHSLSSHALSFHFGNKGNIASLPENVSSKCPRESKVNTFGHIPRIFPYCVPSLILLPFCLPWTGSKKGARKFCLSWTGSKEGRGRDECTVLSRQLDDQLSSPTHFIYLHTFLLFTPFPHS